MHTALLSPLPESAWSPRHARHLLNRAGFGVPRELAASLGTLGCEGAVRRLVEHKHEPVNEPDFLMEPLEEQRRRELYRLDEEQRRRQLQELRQQEREAVDRLKVWWLERMMTTRDPLREKMTLF